jgi:heme/copper-type cytochrome/quinol oxidase subunit 1
MKRVLKSGPGSRWAPRMLGIYGLGLVGASIFSADPALGFPLGTPLENNPISWHGMLHLIVGTIGFIGFIATCFMLARRFNSLQRPGWAWYSLITGILFLVSFVGIASGSKGPVSLFFAIAVVLGFTWISALLSSLKAESER